MNNNFPGGVWPVMLTPFTIEGKVDYKGLEELIEWYKDEGVHGLFAVCQSSEMFFLSLEERMKIARFVKEKAGNLPVIASGHVSDDFEAQVEELKGMRETGVDAVILITNRLAKETESDEIWMENLKKLLEHLPMDMKLGFYECPYPYKRILSKEITKWCAETGRFYFLKDTSCDIESIKAKLEVCKNTNLKLYNANTATLLQSLEAGATGYSGVMANMQGKLYTKLCADYSHEDLTELSDMLSISALIERQCYPVNAKYYLQLEGLNITTKCRVKDEKELLTTFKEEVKMLRRITQKANKLYL
ncbi:dihydrodipicolinate synthase family protein [Sporanaerobium hydrogeniformans]|uniref:Dihydrodipicolinate synthase family protein n=1 Tax=Sporanaerobium hydrogeniformans TaxID=3072179 RepID=A0AC61DC46_9FIRM|nr:dihydrodipicolinate synthase family protein [Sporanaerobium hydrogeniformans]PHV70236.1 dihydrodipicolinate synthase family protein [Sporanaerobium hydrogeniformans]